MKTNRSSVDADQSDQFTLLSLLGRLVSASPSRRRSVQVQIMFVLHPLMPAVACCRFSARHNDLARCMKVQAALAHR